MQLQQLTYEREKWVSILMVGCRYKANKCNNRNTLISRNKALTPFTKSKSYSPYNMTSLIPDTQATGNKVNIHSLKGINLFNLVKFSNSIDTTQILTTTANWTKLLKKEKTCSLVLCSNKENMNLKPDKQTKVIPREHQKHRISTLSKTVRLTTISPQDCRKKLYFSFTQLRGTFMTRIIWLRKAYNSKLTTTMHNIFSINRIYSRWASLKGSSYNMETKSMVHWISMKPSSMVRFKKYESLNSTRALTNQLLTIMSGRYPKLKLRNLRRTCC